MFLNKRWTFIFLLLGYFFSGSLYAQRNTDYKNWTLQELAFSINNDLLSDTDREICVEFYLQKAKETNSTEDVIRAYRKKTSLAKDYTVMTLYADSLLQYATALKDTQIIGSAFSTKSHIEYINKNYKKALEYSLNAEDYLKKAQDDYTLNKVKGSISAIYYHLEEYDKSEQVTREALTYYQSQLHDSTNAYNNLRGYITNIFALCKTNFRQQKNDSLKKWMQEGYKAIHQLLPRDKKLETAYFDLINGMYHNRMKDYRASDSLIQRALHPIKANDDYGNENLAYLYLGKNAWETNHRDKALPYFEKIEGLYLDTKFVNTELSEAFHYLITYYQDKHNIEKELYYTKLLMELSSELHKNNSKLSSYMHTHLDTKKLEASQQKLEYELSKSKSQVKGLYGIVTVLLFVVFLGLLYYQTKQKKLKIQYTHLIAESSEKQKQLQQITPTTKEEQPFLVGVPEAGQLLNTSQILFKKLEDFEHRKGFLQKITQDELARQFGTNRNTLSKFFNEEKNINFSDYLKRLRVQYAVRELTYNPKLHLLNLTGLADEFGFGSSKSFSNSFKEITKISVTDFIKMRQQDQDFKEMDQQPSH
ncbi:helix-turn-helix domain-containing protein [Myroides fluvii]|uniref:helix-turn-helix domain-containing protein n=1 Tax=Myroides fluvii TaxID=2572594 RepID=UPI00131D0B0B|nr:helix-turn-helix domain-containing protein [Myroides fluvii]